MRKIGKKIHELRYLLIILSVCACYAGILYNQTMPASFCEAFLCEKSDRW